MRTKKTRKIKVLIVATSPRLLGGQSIHARSLLESFNGDERVEMAFLPSNPPLKRFGFFQKIKGLRTIFTSMKFWWLLLNEISKFDIVQVSSAGSTGYILATLPPLLCAKLYGKKTILNYHNGDAENHIRNWKLIALPTMRWFDQIVVPSQFLVEVFSKFGLESSAIFNFVDAEKFKFRPRNPLRPVFLSNRTFERHYNVSGVLRAFEIIQQEIPEAELLVAGFGGEESKLKALAEKLNLRNAAFLGRIASEEMPKIYDQADIYLNSSIVDNMPLSIIEAFACGLPVVSSDAGGIPFIIEDEKNGLLVEKNDDHKLAQQAIRLLEDNDLAQMIIANARAECEKYVWKSVREDWRQIYAQISEKLIKSRRKIKS